MNIIPKDSKEDNVEIGIVEEERKEIKLIGSQRRIPGLTLWEIDDVKKTYCKAQFEKQNIELDFTKDIDGQTKLRQKVLLKDDCFYVQKLNEKSLLKFIKKYFGDGFNRAPE